MPEIAPAEDLREQGEQTDPVQGKGEEAQPVEQAKGRFRDPEKARAAGQASAAARRARASASTSDERIVQALRTKAEKGDVNAARELREWRDREQALTHGGDWLAALNEEERAAVLGHINDALTRHGRPGISTAGGALTPAR